MGIAVLFAPLYAGALVALVMVALVWPKPHARPRGPTWPWLWGGLLALTGLLIAARMGLAVPIAFETLAHAFGVILLAAALASGLFATRGRRRAELLISAAPVPLDEAIARARTQASPSFTGVFRARIADEHAVTSPGGVVCAFYQAELREPSADGRRGRLIATERAFTDVLWVRGEAVQVPVAFAPETVFAPEEIRRTLVANTLALSAGRVLADGDAPTEAISWEKVGRQGDTCLVMGRLAPGPAQGSYVIQPAAGAAATVILGEDTFPVAKKLITRSWALFAASVVLFAASAWSLAC